VILALLHLRSSPPRSPIARSPIARSPIVGVIHGLIGAAGFGLLIMTLQGPRRGDAMGVGSFGIFAAVLFGLGLAIGPCIPVLAKRTPRLAGVVIATHASLAVTAFVLFLAWASM
jgi:hypothetical protein